MVELKSIEIKSIAIISLILFAVIGLLFSLPFAFFAFFISSIAGTNDVSPFSGIFGLSFVITLPLFYAIGGTIINVIIAFFYNIIAERVGGLKFRLINLKSNFNRFANVQSIDEINIDDELNRLT